MCRCGTVHNYAVLIACCAVNCWTSECSCCEQGAFHALPAGCTTGGLSVSDLLHDLTRHFVRFGVLSGCESCFHDYRFHRGQHIFIESKEHGQERYLLLSTV